jgi:hypothetical protein
MILRLAAVVAAAAVTLSCAARATGTGVLAPADPAKFTPSSYQPERPFAPQNDGALARPIFRTGAAAPYGAEVRDLLVPPGKSATLAQDGIVVADTREGTGEATVQGQQTRLTPGVTFGVSQGQTATVRNSGQTPLLLRLYVVTAR